MSGTNATLDIGIPVTFGADALTFGGGYSFNDFRVDVSNTDLDLDLSIGPIGIGGDITEIGFAYDNGTYFGRLGYAQIDEDLLGDVSSTGLLVGYRFCERNRWCNGRSSGCDNWFLDGLWRQANVVRGNS